MPAYLSIITGLEISEIERAPRRHLGRIARDTGLFIVGFAMVFIMLGLTATTLAQALVHRQALITRISGLAVLAFVLFIAGSLVLKSPLLYQERRFRPRLSRYGPLVAPIAGMAFGFGWTPCIGPVLGSVLAIAATQAHAVRGATLLAAYSLGLGVPFLAAGLAFGRMAGAFGGGSPTPGAVTNPAAFSLLALNGNGGVRLAHYRGKPVVVNFLAFWCTECQTELPGFRQEATALKGKVSFIGVDSLETGDKNFLPSRFHLAGAFAALARDAGPDGNGLHAALGGGNTMPLTAFYGAGGGLLDVERAALVPAAALKAKIARLFGVTR